MSKKSIRYTDEFKKQIVALINNGKYAKDIIDEYKIDRSLSKKGCPYDNAVAKATFKIVKTEFAFNKIFNSFKELEYLLFDYVNCYNNKRIHGSLGYLTPVEYRKMMSNKNVS